MASTKISALAAVTASAGANEFAVNEAGTSKKASLTQILTYLQANGMPRVKKLTANHTISSVTATEVTDLRMSLEAGTYAFDYYLIVQSATTTVGMFVHPNFATGTAAVKAMFAFWPDATTVITAETHIMDNEGISGAGFISGRASVVWQTTTPTLGTNIGVTAINTDLPMRITGIVIVTVAGELALWHSSETATATSVMAGSSLVVVRTA